MKYTIINTFFNKEGKAIEFYLEFEDGKQSMLSLDVDVLKDKLLNDLLDLVKDAENRRVSPIELP